MRPKVSQWFRFFLIASAYNAAVLSILLCLFPDVLSAEQGIDPIGLVATASLVFGLLYTLISFWLSYRLNPTDLPSGKSMSRTLEFSLPYDDLFSICLESATILNPVQKPLVDPKLGIIEFKTDFTLKSYGERVSLRLSRLADNRIRIELTSRLLNPLDKMDYGKNHSNIETLADFITQLAAPIPY